MGLFSRSSRPSKPGGIPGPRRGGSGPDDPTGKGPREGDPATGQEGWLPLARSADTRSVEARASEQLARELDRTAHAGRQGSGPAGSLSSGDLRTGSRSATPEPADMETGIEEEEAFGDDRHLSPFALKLQEKQHQLDGLKTRLGSLTQAFEQMNTLYMESRHSISMLTDFLERSRAQVETEIRLKSENAKISTDLIDSNHKVHSLSGQLAEAQAELSALRKRHGETRTALETARNELISIRDNNRKVNEDHKAQSLELLQTRTLTEELRGSLGDLEAKYQALEAHSEALQANLEEMSGREKHLQQKLSESAQQLDEELKRANVTSTQLEATKRQNAEVRSHNIDLKSQLDMAQQELSFARSRLEEEQRKHDNEIYTLKSEVETLSSQRRVSAQTLQEMTRDNTGLREKNRNLVKRMQEIEHLLGSAQKNHERDRNDLVTASEKLRELNLRYNSALTDLNHQRNQAQKYADRIEDLVQENKKLQNYKLQVDLANEQIVQLKGLVRNYQIAMEGRGPAEELGLTGEPGENTSAYASSSAADDGTWESLALSPGAQRETERPYSFEDYAFDTAMDDFEDEIGSDRPEGETTLTGRAEEHDLSLDGSGLSDPDSERLARETRDALTRSVLSREPAPQETTHDAKGKTPQKPAISTVVRLRGD